MAERGVSMVDTTIMRWVHHYAPEFGRRWNRFARPAGGSWRVDETDVKNRGKWVYLYRATPLTITLDGLRGITPSSTGDEG